MLAVLCGVRHGHPAVWRRWLQRLGESGVQASSWEAVLRHLVGRWQGGDVESNNLVWEFLWVTQRVEQAD